MTGPNHKLRAEVMATIEDVIREARAAGQGPLAAMDAAKLAFPGTPDMVMIMASANVDVQLEEEWWQSVERTIDVEMIKTAIAKVGGAA